MPGCANARPNQGRFSGRKVDGGLQPLPLAYQPFRAT